MAREILCAMTSLVNPTFSYIGMYSWRTFRKVELTSGNKTSHVHRTNSIYWLNSLRSQHLRSSPCVTCFEIILLIWCSYHCLNRARYTFYTTASMWYCTRLFVLGIHPFSQYSTKQTTSLNLQLTSHLGDFFELPHHPKAVSSQALRKASSHHQSNLVFRTEHQDD